MPTKEILRETLRAQRRALGKVEREEKASQLAFQISQLALWPRCGQIALYFASDGEIDPKYIASSAKNSGKEVFLPIVKKNRFLEFALWQDGAALCVNRFGIPEPDQCAPKITAPDLGMICLPIVGWDRQGNRLGMGGGFYDKTLTMSSGRGCLVGLAFSMQECAELPSEPYDVPLDFVVTENEIVSTARRTM